jgi:murein DD-endopeptidase MepM/ murein hydrolase activator NlpD
MGAMLWLLFACIGPDPLSDEIGTRFGFPLPERDRFPTLVGVDHDPVVQDDTLVGRATCSDYEERGFPHCYDEHGGSDYLLEGGFEAMDAGSSPIVAAADGVVVEIADGNYDRCHADLESGEVSCDGNPKASNHVILEHADGVFSLYWHLMSGSVAVAVGDAVACGDAVGIVGSSGESSTPHLHFEINDADGKVLDPYAGPASQPTSLWAEQRAIDELPGPGCAQ